MRSLVWKGALRSGLGLVVALSAAACGGSSVRNIGGDDTGTGDKEGVPLCTADPEGDPRPWSDADRCLYLERLSLFDPRVEDASGDGSVSPGERARIEVTLKDVSGLGHLDHPGVVFEINEIGLSFVSDPRDFQVFGLLGCDSVNGEVEVIAADVEPGTQVELVARAGTLNHHCPNAPSLVIPIRVR